MKFSIRDLLLVTVIVALVTRASTADADDLKQIEHTIEADSPNESAPWERQELARAAIAKKDFATCDRAIQHLKERAERKEAVRRVCEVAARVLDDSAIIQLASDMPSWQIVKGDDGQKDAVETLVNSLCEAGRCAQASEIGKAANLAPTLEVKIFRGDLEGAKRDLGAPVNGQRAVLAAARSTGRVPTTRLSPF